MNRIIGKSGAAVTGAAVLAFATAMIVALFVKGDFASCFASIFIALGFVPFVAAVAAIGRGYSRAAGYAGVAFAAVYAVIVLLVYFAEVTTVRMNARLSNEALSLISYGYTGSLFFNFDLLGYAIMALSTFLTGFTVVPRDKGDNVFRWMLWIHGIFFLSCLIVPLFPVFTPGTSNVPGTILLEIWCAYFLPVCILGFRYFGHRA